MSAVCVNILGGCDQNPQCASVCKHLVSDDSVESSETTPEETTDTPAEDAPTE